MPEIPPELLPAGPGVPPLEHPPVGTSAPLAGCVGFDAVGPDGQLRPVCVVPSGSAASELIEADPDA
eukprot:284573-Lingulodinium_polyedra.AAC.1